MSHPQPGRTYGENEMFNDEAIDEKDLELVVDGRSYSVTAQYYFTDEYCYGADSDGNRGMLRRDLYDCVLLNAFDTETGAEVKDAGLLARLTKLAEKEA